MSLVRLTNCHGSSPPTITSTISTPVYGKLSDIYGRRRLLMTCLVFFIATSLLCATARSLGQLIAFRALQDWAGGWLMALTQAVIADIIGMLLLGGAISVLLLALGWGCTTYGWGSREIYREVERSQDLD